MTNYKLRFEALNVAVNNTRNLSLKMHDRKQGIIQEPLDTRSTREKLDDKAMQNIEFRKKYINYSMKIQHLLKSLFQCLKITKLLYQTLILHILNYYQLMKIF